MKKLLLILMFVSCVARAQTNTYIPSSVGPDFYVTATGSVNTLVATFSPVISSLSVGLEVDVLPNLANTSTTPTLNVNGTGAKPITRSPSNAPLFVGDLQTTVPAKFLYDGTNWELINPQVTNQWLATGTYDNNGFYFNTQTLLNGSNPAVENAGVNLTEASTAGVIVPSGSTETQVDAVGGFVRNLSPNTNAVAIYGFGRTPVNGVGGATSGLWGANFNIQNCIGCTGSKMTGLEIDVNQQGPDATFGQSLIQDGLNIISAGTNKARTGIVVQSQLTSNYWQQGMLLANFQTSGLQLSNYASGADALNVTPPDDTSAVEVFGTNHADNAEVWTIGNNGAANFLSVTANSHVLSAAQVEYCGATTGGTQACAKTVQALPLVVYGDVLLNGAATQSITTLPFTGSTYSCSGSDLTAAAGIVSFNTYANASVVIAESGGGTSDHLRYQCVGN